MIHALLLAALMLTQQDSGALRNARLTPNAINSIAAALSTRPAVFARATYAVYTGPQPQTIIMSFVIPGNTLGPGDQFVGTVMGTASFASGSGPNPGAFVQLSQNGIVVQTIGITASLANTGGTAVAWRSDFEFGANVPGLSGQYLPSLTSVGASPRKSIPQASIGLTGGGSTLITNTALSGGLFSGGKILANGDAAGQSFMLNTRTQATLSNALPIEIDVLISLVPTGSEVTVQSGYVMGL